MHVLTHFGTGDRVRLFLIEYELSPGALYELQGVAITLAETTQPHLDEVDGPSVAHNFVRWSK